MYALLVSDGADEAAILTLVLQRVGLAVTSDQDLDRAMRSWPERPADLVVLASHQFTPLAQVQHVRSEAEVPVVLIADARTVADEETHAGLFEEGADLVVIRPYSARLLIAQLRSLLRRMGGVSLFSLPNLSLGGLTLDPATRTCQPPGVESRRLTHLEFRLLYTLMIHRGQVIPTETIVERVWGYTGEGNRDLVRGLVSRLRAKIEIDPHAPQLIVTIPGLGYRFDA